MIRIPTWGKEGDGDGDGSRTDRGPDEGRGVPHGGETLGLDKDGHLRGELVEMCLQDNFSKTFSIIKDQEDQEDQEDQTPTLTLFLRMSPLRDLVASSSPVIFVKT